MPDTSEPIGLWASTLWLRWSVKALVICLVVFTAWRYLWLSDDALITLRSAINWVAGFGPQYNASERVVGYTHPLWFVLLTITGAVTGSWIYAPLYLSLGLAAAASAWVVARTRTLWQFLTVSSVVLFSNTVTDWSSSGLEGPLAALLICALIVSLDEHALPRRPIVTGLLIGATLLCRLDLILLMAPWGAFMAWQLRGELRRLLLTALGVALPLLLWAMPTVLYYGFLLPSTFTAKTNSVIPRPELLERGATYVWLSMGYDPATALFLVSMALLCLITRQRMLCLWTAGAVIYWAYVIWVGGDYMLGRFFYVPLIALLMVLTRSSLPSDSRIPRSGERLLLVIPLLIVTLGAPHALSMRFGESSPTIEDPNSPIVDERPWWVQMGRGLDPLGLENPHEGIIPSDLKFLEGQAKAWPKTVPVGPQPKGSVLVRCGGLGAIGFLLPNTFVIDSCALTDRFLAEQPFVPPSDGSTWKAGHFTRTPPDGYVQAVEKADPSLVTDPELRQRLADLWQVIRPN